ncbi:MAG TPA: recombinase family protein [Spirochaetales bacterium]|nr:recombinase family protein [Spirochaetales bacterium]
MKVTKVYGELAQKKKRVAAYCRVSTDTAGQQESYDTQLRYYKTLIPANHDWEFAGVYADEGRSGTSVKHRPEFLRLMQDAEQGQIDIILTKSISRFARNVVDCQRYVKDLKSRGVEVRFEREGISSMDASADFIFSMLATVAQEESRSISENVRWRYAKDFEKGVYRLGGNRILGYDMGDDGKLTPNGDAWIIKKVFDNFLAGMNYTEIAADLDAAGAKRLRSDKPYTAERIRRILRNEYYVGDMLLRKNAPKDFLTKCPIHTDYTSYYIRDAHVGIIDRNTWERAKEKLDAVAADKAAGLVFNCTETHFLYGKAFCGECGAPYTRRTFTDRKGAHYKAWNCRERQKGKKGNGCKNSAVREEILLAEIADAMQLEKFDRTAFDALVERVMITPDGIQVQLKNNSNPMVVGTVSKTA